MRTILGNVEEMKREYPGFETPPVEHRGDLRPGDLAELMFLSERMNPEAHWAAIEEVMGPGWYRGILDTGEQLEFGSENVADIRIPPPQMGVSVWDFFGEKREPRPGKKPSIWDTEAHAAYMEAERARKAAQPRRSFWDIFRRKPKTELMPIPPSERRHEREEVIHLPFSKVEAPPPIIPPEVKVTGEPEETVDYFDVLSEEGLPSPPPGGIIVPEMPPPPPPGGELVMPETGRPTEIFDVLETPSGLMVPESGAQLPTQEVFEVLSPGPSQEIVPFDVLPAKGMVVHHPTEPFDVLPPEGRMMVRPEAGLFDVLEPKIQQPLQTYTAPTTHFEELIQPAPVEEKREKPKRKKKLEMSINSSSAQWKRWIEETFHLDEVWQHIRDTRKDSYFQHTAANEEMSGLPATIAIWTWPAGEWPQMFEDLGIPSREYEPYLEAMDREERDIGYHEEAWEEFNQQVLDAISTQMEAAFEALQPGDIRGSITLGEDGLTEGQTYGIVYYEPMSDKERERILKTEEEAAQAERAERKKREGKKKGLEKERKQELRKIWGAMPAVDEVIPWAEQMYGPGFWKEIRENRKKQAWKRELEDAAERNEYAVMELEAIADAGEGLYDALAAYFGIPPEVFSLYLGSENGQFDLWQEVLIPYFQIAADAVNSLKPKNLPGFIEFAWDDDEMEFFVKYLENPEEEK